MYLHFSSVVARLCMSLCVWLCLDTGNYNTYKEKLIVVSMVVFLFWKFIILQNAEMWTSKLYKSSSVLFQVFW